MAPNTNETNVTSKKEKCLENVQKILECPVCYKTPGNPDNVHFCSNGHLLCDGCYEKILDKKCPSCRSGDWNSQNTLIPLMKQLLSALPKECPFPECEEIQFENEDRDIHMKKCQYRLVDCFDCSLKLPFNTFLKHQKEVEKAYLRKSTDGYFLKKIRVNDTDFSDKTKASWISTMIEFDDQTFITVCYIEQDHFYFQMLIHANITQAEKYLWQIKLKNKEDPRYNTSFSGAVISVDVPENDQKTHFGTFSFSKTMARKFLCKDDDDQILSLDLTIFKKE